MQGLGNYEFHSKRHYRRWIWNRVVERTERKPKELVAAYLAGPNDADRAIAKSKGFKDGNLIAIDIDNQCVEPIKKSKNPAICIDMVDFINNWSGNQKIDVIVADFCSGITKKIGLTFMQALFNSNGLSSWPVIAINLMRGRDAIGGYYSKQIYQETGEHIKHRGMQFLMHFSWHYYNWIVGESLRQLGHDADMNGYHLDNELYGLMIKEMVPAFHSYKSVAGNIYMDSIVFRYAKFDTGTIEQRNMELVRKLAAFKAWRTMRNNNKIKATRGSAIW